MKSITLTFVLRDDLITGYLSQYVWQRNHRVQVGTTQVRHIHLPAGPVSPAALLGAFAEAFGGRWDAEYSVTAKPWSAPPAGATGENPKPLLQGLE